MISDRELGERESGHFRRFRERLSIFKSARESYFHSYRRDPLARLLIHRLRLSPLVAAGVGFGLVGGTYLLGLLVSVILHQEIAGITQTVIDWLYDFILVPLTFGYYTWMATAPSRVLVRIRQNGVLLVNGESIEQFSAVTVRTWLHGPLVFLFGAAGSLLMAVLHLRESWAFSPAWGGHGANHWVFVFVKVPFIWVIPWYMVCVIFLKEILFILRLRKMLAHPGLRLDPQNPDHCGGLGVVSEYLLHFTTFLTACGFGLLLIYLRAQRFGYSIPGVVVHGVLALYLFLCGFFFFFPLHPVHKALTRWKQELQRKLPFRDFFPVWAYTPETVGRLLLLMFVPLLIVGLIIHL